MRKILIVLGLSTVTSFSFAVTPPSSSVVVEIKGQIFPKDSVPAECKQMILGAKCPKEPFGKFHVVGEKQGDLVYSKATFADHDGVEVTEQTWEKGGRITKGSIENKQLGIVSSMEVVDGRVYYKVLKDGKEKKSQDRADPNLVMSTTLMAYLRPKFDEILAGKELQIKMAVLDRMDSFTFNIKKFREARTVSGGKLVVLKMSPNSMIISALVDPVYFYIDNSSGQLIGFEGRSALRRKIGDKFKEMEAQTAYEHVVDTFKRNQANPSLHAANDSGCSDADMLKPGLNSKCVINKEESNANSSSKK